MLVNYFVRGFDKLIIMRKTGPMITKKYGNLYMPLRSHNF